MISSIGILRYSFPKRMYLTNTIGHFFSKNKKERSLARSAFNFKKKELFKKFSSIPF